MMTSQVARKLADRGLLRRSIDKADTRARHLCLTPSGRALLSTALADVEAADEIHFHTLGSQREAFLTALATLDSVHNESDPTVP